MSKSKCVFVILVMNLTPCFISCSETSSSKGTDANAISQSIDSGQNIGGFSGSGQTGVDAQTEVVGQGGIDSGDVQRDGSTAVTSGQDSNPTTGGSGGTIATSDSGGSESGIDSGLGDSGSDSGAGDSGVSDSGGDTVSSDCTRDMLRETIDAYYAALAAHDISNLPLASDVKFTENGKPLELGEGLWQTAGTAKLMRSALDTVDCASVTESVITEANADIVLGLRLKVEQQMITEIETIVVRNGDGFVNPAALVGTQNDDWETLLSVDQRPTREQLKRIVDLYFMLFPNGACNFSPDCVRFENGFSPGSCTGFGIGCPNPDAVTDSSNANMVPRQYVLDIEAGIAVGFVMWRGTSTDFHMFKVRNGDIQGVHAILIATEGSGWD